MKKIIITLVFSMIAIVAFAFSSNADTLYASAANYAELFQKLEITTES